MIDKDEDTSKGYSFLFEYDSSNKKIILNIKNWSRSYAY